MSALRRLWTALLTLLACGGYVDTYTPAGTPNLRLFAAPGAPIWRTGLPPSARAWAELRSLVERGVHVTRVVLHDDAEGDESAATQFGWNVVKIPLTPEDDRPLTVFVRPSRVDVERAVQAILDAHARGEVVVFGCLHGRDRTGLVAGLLGMRLLGWTKDEAWDYALATGMRWELPNLDAYWLEEVP